MKRSICGLTMLVVLLIIGIFTTWFMQHCHRTVAASLEAAATFAETENWAQAQQALNRALAQWDARWGISAALTDHEPMEEVNSLFAQAGVYARAENALGFCDVCARLCEELDAIGEAHSVAWWNIA